MRRYYEKYSKKVKVCAVHIVIDVDEVPDIINIGIEY